MHYKCPSRSKSLVTPFVSAFVIPSLLMNDRLVTCQRANLTEGRFANVALVYFQPLVDLGGVQLNSKSDTLNDDSACVTAGGKKVG